MLTPQCPPRPSPFPASLHLVLDQVLTCPEQVPLVNFRVNVLFPGEGNGNPLQYSCLENPMDGGAWWAAAHWVAKSRPDRATSLSLFPFMHWRRKWQPTPVFLPGESQGRGSLVGCRLWGRTELDTTEATQQYSFPI